MGIYSPPHLTDKSGHDSDIQKNYSTSNLKLRLDCQQCRQCPKLNVQRFVDNTPSQTYVLFEDFSPFTVIISSTLLGRLSTRFQSVAVRMCAHLTARALVRSGTDVEREGLGSNQHPSLSQCCSVVLRSELCAGHSSSSTLNTMSSWISFCSLEYHLAGTGSGLSVPRKGNCKPRAYKDILYNFCASSFVTTVWGRTTKGPLTT